MFRGVGILLSLTLCASVATGCYPHYTLVQPALTVTVTNAEGQALDGVSVYFASASNPHHMLHHKAVVETDAAGVAQFDAAREWELHVPIMIHGVPFYYFVWCVDSPGYRPVRRNRSASDVWCTVEDAVTLEVGDNWGQCREEFDRLRPWGEEESTDERSQSKNP